MNSPQSPPPFQDDSMLEGSARQVMSDISQFFSKERLERAAVEDERVRLARDLHDGVLQSLAGSLMNLEALSRLIDEDPRAARKRLQDIGDLIADEQRELRVWISKLKPAAKVSMASSVELAEALETLCQRAETQAGLRVNMTISRGMIERGLGDEVYNLVREGLSNVMRHARATSVEVGLQITHDRVNVTIADDGVGFPFCGRYELPTLVHRRLGPRSLKERVASLGGELVLTSSEYGSRLEMSLPAQSQRPKPVKSDA